MPAAEVSSLPRSLAGSPASRSCSSSSDTSSWASSRRVIGPQRVPRKTSWFPPTTSSSAAPAAPSQPDMQPAPGSWRDPSSRVFVDGDRVLRVLDADALADFQALAASTFFNDAVSDGRIVATKLVDEVPSELAGTQWAGVLEHERIPVI